MRGAIQSERVESLSNDLRNLRHDLLASSVGKDEPADAVWDADDCAQAADDRRASIASDFIMADG